MKWQPGKGLAVPDGPPPLFVHDGRISWIALHHRWLRTDQEMKRTKSAQHYQMFRHGLMPPKLDGRLDRMLRRIASNARLLSAQERHQARKEWIQASNVRRARFQLADSVRTLRRHIRRGPEHPRGGLRGRTEEFSPMLRRFLKGQDDDLTFIVQTGWALRLLDGAANPGEEN